MIGINNTSPLQRLETTKKEIRSLLISAGSRDVTISELKKMYKQILDLNIPFTEFNYTSLKDFLYSMPDVVDLRYNANNELCVYHVDTEKSKHISYLVSKEKKKVPGKLENKQSYKNCVDPHLLNEILQEFKFSCKNSKNKVLKTYVLSAIIDRIGLYSFYTMGNLNNQLYELNHVLTHDDNYIYFKENFLSCTNDNIKQARKSMIQKIDIYNNHAKASKNINKNLSKVNVDVLIKDNTKSRMQKLIEKHPEGIWCSELPSVFRREYGLDLEYINLGFNSIVEFVDALPDIVQIIVPPKCKTELIVNSKTCLSNKNLEIDSEKLQVKTNSQKLDEFEENDTGPIPTRLSAEVSKTLIPQCVMNVDETVKQIDVTSLKDSDKYLDIIIAEVHNPSFFWIILRKNKKIINQLMTNLDDFYDQQNLDDYKIPEIVIQKGLHIACKYAEVWHRGIIKKIKPNGVLILFYDYGTIKTYNMKEIYFLNRKFSAIPAQAIPCNLDNIKPVKASKWPVEVIKEFTDKVFEKPFIATISNADKETNSMAINVLDIIDEDNVEDIGLWMVSNKLAMWGVSKNIKRNFTYSYYKEYIKNKQLNYEEKKKQSTNENKISDENFEIKNNVTENYINLDKKLKALEIYKENYIKSCQKSSLTISPDSNNINIEQKTDKQVFHSESKDSTEKDESIPKLTYENSINNSINSSPLLCFSLNSKNFIYNDNITKRDEVLSKKYNNKKNNSDTILINNYSNALKELNSLILSMKS